MYFTTCFDLDLYIFNFTWIYLNFQGIAAQAADVTSVSLALGRKV